MKRLFFGMFLLGSLLVRPLSAQIAKPSGFPEFWKKFQAAVLKEDSEAVAGMTYLPFYWGATLNKAGFLKVYPNLFDAKARECFRKGELTEDGAFQILFCGRLMYRFGADAGTWRMLEISDND